MDNRPIGIFDSGVGGLTAVKAVREVMPNENILYFANTKYMPYGDKDKNTIIDYTRKSIAFLKSCNAKVILAACGTVSSYLENIDEEVFGVIKPSCFSAFQVAINGKIGILATPATIRSNSYKREIANLSEKIKCYQCACPTLASMIENGHISAKDDDLRETLSSHISPFIKEGVDTIILGCTHYPIVSPVIEDIFGPDLNLINPSFEAVKKLKEVLKIRNLRASEGNSVYEKFYISGDKNKFLEVAKLFLRADISSMTSHLN